MNKRESNRERHAKQMVDELKGVPLGDLLKELITIGDVNNIHTKRDLKAQMRHPLIVSELNRRWEIVEETNNGLVDLIETLEAEQEEPKKKKKKASK